MPVGHAAPGHHWQVRAYHPLVLYAAELAAGRKRNSAKPPLILLSRGQPAEKKFRLSRRFIAGLAELRSSQAPHERKSREFFPKLNYKNWNIIICRVMYRGLLYVGCDVF